jgi:hypothetical protein
MPQRVSLHKGTPQLHVHVKLFSVLRVPFFGWKLGCYPLLASVDHEPLVYLGGSSTSTTGTGTR